MAKLRTALKFEDLSPLDEDASFSGTMKLKAKQIHFGNQPVSYDITHKGFYCLWVTALLRFSR
jgi:hypothetical protein